MLVWDPARPGGGPVEFRRRGGAVLAVLPDGRVVTGRNDSVLVWDPARRRRGPVELGCHGYPAVVAVAVAAVAVLPDGRVVTGGNDGVLVWDVTTRTEIAQLGCSVTALATRPFGPSESSLVVAHHGAGFSLWSVIGGPE